MTSKDIVTNEEIMATLHDFMQMAGDGFVKLEDRMGGLEDRMATIELDLREIKSKLYDHDLQLGELKEIALGLLNQHRSYISDIKDLLDRVDALEKRAPNITDKEIRELQRSLQVVIDWALKAAKTVKIPLKLHV